MNNTRSRDTDNLVFLRKKLKDLSKPKAEKEIILGEIRSLEKKLGLPSVSYNSADFSN